MHIKSSAVASLALVLTACGAKFRAEDFPSTHAFAEAAVLAAQEGECGSALPALRRVLFDLPPGDTLLPWIRFASGICHVEASEFLEGSRQFRRVADDYPSHELAGLALVRAGSALSKLWRRPELDPTYGQNAMSTFREVAARFPGTPAADSARVEINRLQEWFAEKEFKNAEYYRRIRAWDSAITYYRGVVANYPQSSYAPRALLRMVEIFDRIGFTREREDACTYLQRFHPSEDGVGDACPT